MANPLVGGGSHNPEELVLAGCELHPTDGKNRQV